MSDDYLCACGETVSLLPGVKELVVKLFLCYLVLKKTIFLNVFPLFLRQKVTPGSLASLSHCFLCFVVQLTHQSP